MTRDLSSQGERGAVSAPSWEGEGGVSVDGTLWEGCRVPRLLSGLGEAEGEG